MSDARHILPGLRVVYHGRAPVFYVRWGWLIRLAWGPRRVSSRADSGTQAYPDEIGASAGMWLAWMRQNIPRRWRGQVYIVVSTDKEGHGARYAKELLEAAKAALARDRRADVERRLPELQARRAAARAARDFATADAIRAEIEAAGFSVNDQRIGMPMPCPADK